ncbi:hypothetical protein [Synechococcus sp. MIT S1220]|uniref:hypothetical protein n=1 Tax=Synechococcus sp. MIT S1220 TaxID=3082549 RepID=UPI0039B09AF0
MVIDAARPPIHGPKNCALEEDEHLVAVATDISLQSKADGDVQEATKQPCSNFF